jgi:hypothetical protein
VIDKEGCLFILYCDVCGEAVDKDFYEFQEAVDYKKANGWKSQTYHGEWEDVCPDCWGEEG